MRRLFGLLGVMALSTLAVLGQDCKDCRTENPLIGVECKVVNGGEHGGDWCFVLEGGCLLEGYPDCYSCSMGACEQGAVRKPNAKYVNLRVRQLKERFNITLDAEAIRGLAKRSPELAYAVASAIGSKRGFVEGSAIKFTWLPFRIDASDAELWLNPTTARARSYFGNTRAEGLAAFGRGVPPVEVLLELNGNELSVIALGGVPASNGRYIKLKLAKGAITRANTQVAMNRR